MKALGIFICVVFNSQTIQKLNQRFFLWFRFVVFPSKWPVAISYSAMEKHLRVELKESPHNGLNVLIEVNTETQSDVSDEPFAGSTSRVFFPQPDNQKEVPHPPPSFISIFVFPCSLLTFTNVLLISSWLISKPFSSCTEAKGRAENRYSHLGCKNSSRLTVQCMSPRSRGREKWRRLKKADRNQSRTRKLGFSGALIDRERGCRRFDVRRRCNS